MSATTFPGKPTDGVAVPRMEQKDRPLHPLYCHAIRWLPLLLLAAVQCRDKGAARLPDALPL